MKVFQLQPLTLHPLQIMNMLHNQHLSHSKLCPLKIFNSILNGLFVSRVDDPYFVHVPLHLHQNGTNNQNSQIMSQLNVEELTHSDASIANFERLRRVYHFPSIIQ